MQQVMNIRDELYGKVLLVIFLFLFLFSNVLTRLFIVDFNALFYLSVILLLFYFYYKTPFLSIGTIYFVSIVFFILYALFPGYFFKANLLSIKDVVVPIFCLQLGLLFSRYESLFVRLLNYLFLPFVIYGIMQEIFYLSGILPEMLPWDDDYISMLVAGGAMNIFQGVLLRFFGTMNAFVEYQTCIIIIPMFLWLECSHLKNRVILILNSVLAGIFIIVAVERSPIMMAVIALLIWKRSSLKRIFNYKSLSIVFATIILLIFIGNLFEDDPSFGFAYDRLTNIVTLNFSDDYAVRERQDVLWADAMKLALRNPYGILPGRVVPAAASYSGYIAPHNNYLIMFLGYGIIGFILFISLLYKLLIMSNKTDASHKKYFQGMLIAYLGMSMFNFPFLGKSGILFFLLSGFIIARIPDVLKKSDIVLSVDSLKSK